MEIDSDVRIVFAVVDSSGAVTAMVSSSWDRSVHWFGLQAADNHCTLTSLVAFLLIDTRIVVWIDRQSVSGILSKVILLVRVLFSSRRVCLQYVRPVNQQNVEKFILRLLGIGLAIVELDTGRFDVLILSDE